jgi:branched-chain amino acid transport system permease protein
MADEIAVTDDRFGIIGRSTLLRHTLFAVVGLGVLYLLIQSLSDYRNSQLAPVAFTVCAVAGLTLLVGLSGQISLGHGAFMAVGAYTLALIQGKWTLNGHGNLQLIALLAGSAAVAAVFGAVVGVAAARLRGPYLAGATLALAIGLPSVASYEKLSGKLGGNSGLTVLSPNPPSGMDFYKWQSIICCLAAVVVLWFLANVSRSRVGRSFRAVRDDEIAASLCGLSVGRTQTTAFILSAGCAGLSGALLAVVLQLAQPGAFPLQLSLSLLTGVVLGGLGSLVGAVWGAALLTLLPNWTTDIAHSFSLSTKVSANMPLAIYGIVLIVAMILWPSGIQGGLRALFGRLRAARGSA